MGILPAFVMRFREPLPSLCVQDYVRREADRIFHVLRKLPSFLMRAY